MHLNSFSQELFVFTEPASNMPAKSLGFRDMNGFFLEKDGKLNYHNMPELMWGINKKWMVHAQGFISNRQDGGFETEGGSARRRVAGGHAGPGAGRGPPPRDETLTQI